VQLSASDTPHSIFAPRSGRIRDLFSSPEGGWVRSNRDREAAQVFPQSACWFAPVWILERVIRTYAAFCWYLVRGGYPFGDRILSRGIGRDWFVGGKIASAGWRGR
jgi:hypothetical protein